MFFFFKQKTAYEMRISDWSSDVCSSDLALAVLGLLAGCAETELAVHNAKRLQEPGSAATTQMGAYKVGKPYQIANVWYYPHEDYTYDESGIASWYGPGFHGQLTANGEDRKSVV